MKKSSMIAIAQLKTFLAINFGMEAIAVTEIDGLCGSSSRSRPLSHLERPGLFAIFIPHDAAGLDAGALTLHLRPF